jgi:TonB-dependent SusC/RagA subfamily outer membrane receptor
LFSGSSANRGVDLDHNIIESISVLKGAAASALYGSRAANGVILVTTKTGKVAAGRKGPTIAVNSTFGWDEARIAGFQKSYLQGLNGQYQNGRPAGQGGYAEVPGGTTQTTGSWGPHKDSVSLAVIDSIGRPGIYDPREAFYQTGRTYDNSVSLSGANEVFNYFTSFSDLRQEGIVPGTKLNRNSVLAKFGVKLSEKFDVTASVNYVKTYNKWLAEGNGAQSYLYGLNFTPISYDIRDYRDPVSGAQRMYNPNFNNPLWLAKNNGLYSNVDRLIANATLNYEILP